MVLAWPISYLCYLLLLSYSLFLGILASSEVWTLNTEERPSISYFSMQILRTAQTIKLIYVCMLSKLILLLMESISISSINFFFLTLWSPLGAYNPWTVNIWLIPTFRQLYFFSVQSSSSFLLLSYT